MEQATTTTTRNRAVTVLTRYFIHATSTIVLHVENDQGARHYVTLQRNGKHSCSCSHVPSKKSPTCYHIDRCLELETSRTTKTMGGLAIWLACCIRQAMTTRTASQNTASAPAPATRNLLNVPLNNRNQGFSILRRAPGASAPVKVGCL